MTAECTVKGKNPSVHPSLRLLSLIQFRDGRGGGTKCLGVRGGVNVTVMASDVSDVTQSRDTIAFLRFVQLYLRTNCFPQQVIFNLS